MSSSKPATEFTIPVRASVCYCGECGKLHILDLHDSTGIKLEDVKQARWLDGWAELDHGGWLCPKCMDSHADHGLREAADIVRESHLKIRVKSNWATQNVRGR